MAYLSYAEDEKALQREGYTKSNFFWSGYVVVCHKTVNVEIWYRDAAETGGARSYALAIVDAITGESFHINRAEELLHMMAEMLFFIGNGNLPVGASTKAVKLVSSVQEHEHNGRIDTILEEL